MSKPSLEFSEFRGSDRLKRVQVLLSFYTPYLLSASASFLNTHARLPNTPTPSPTHPLASLTHIRVLGENESRPLPTLGRVRTQHMAYCGYLGSKGISGRKVMRTPTEIHFSLLCTSTYIYSTSAGSAELLHAVPADPNPALYRHPEFCCLCRNSRAPPLSLSLAPKSAQHGDASARFLRP